MGKKPGRALKLGGHGVCLVFAPGAQVMDSHQIINWSAVIGGCEPRCDVKPDAAGPRSGLAK